MQPTMWIDSKDTIIKYNNQFENSAEENFRFSQQMPMHLAKNINIIIISKYITINVLLLPIL